MATGQGKVRGAATLRNLFITDVIILFGSVASCICVCGYGNANRFMHGKRVAAQLPSKRPPATFAASCTAFLNRGARCCGEMDAGKVTAGGGGAG